MKPKVHLTGLSHKSTEAQTLRILRLNDDTSGNIIKYKDDKANVQVRSTTPIVKRKRLPNEAGPPASDLFRRKDYEAGMGEFQIYGQRPGAHDHLKYKSHGDAT